MARTNESIVYGESKLAICRKLGSSDWEVRSQLGFATTKVPTDKGGERTVLVRVEGDGAVLETTPNGAKARLTAVRHSLTLGLITEEEAAKRIVALTPVKK